MTDSAAAPVVASTKVTVISVHAEKLPSNTISVPTCTSAIDPNGVVMVVAACPDGLGPSMNALLLCALQWPPLAVQLQLRPVYCSTSLVSFALARRSRRWPSMPSAVVHTKVGVSNAQPSVATHFFFRSPLHGSMSAHCHVPPTRPKAHPCVAAHFFRLRPLQMPPMPMAILLTALSAETSTSMPHASSPTRFGQGMAPKNVEQTTDSGAHKSSELEPLSVPNPTTVNDPNPSPYLKGTEQDV